MNSLSPIAKKGLCRLGDIICPKNDEFPSYTELGVIDYVDGMLETAPEPDIKDLGLVLSILAYMPDFALKWLVKSMNESHHKNGFISTLFRQLDFGIKGIIFSTYYSGEKGHNYSGKTPTDVIDFSINRMEL